MKVIYIVIALTLFLNPLLALDSNTAWAQEGSDSIDNQATDVNEPTFAPDEKYEKKFQGDPAIGEAWTKPPLKINGADMIAVEAGKVDVRVLKYLNWLTTRKEDGGANHHHIKVSRIIKNYKGKKSTSKETDYEDVAPSEEPEEVTQSAHREEDAMAVDISEIDTYRCEIKKPDGGTEKTPPQPIQIAWQDKAPGDTLGDPAGGFTGGNYFDAGEAFYSAGFLTGIADDMQSGVENFRLNDNSLPGIILGLGIANFNEDLGVEFTPTGDLKTTVEQLGKNILSQQTGLPPETFSGENKDEWLASIVLGEAEKELGLLTGSLTGGKTDTDSLIIQTGMRAAEEILTLRPQILNSSEQTGFLDLAQAKIESLFELPAGSFQGSKSEIEKTVGGALDDIIGSVERADERLGLASATTAKLLKGETSIGEYTSKVAVQMKNQSIDRYDAQYGKIDFKSALFGAYGELLETTQPKIDQRKNSEYVWDIPTDSIDLLLSGQMKKFYRSVGVWRLGKAMGLPQTTIDDLVFRAKVKEIDSFSVAESHTKPLMTSDDWLALFKDDQTVKKEKFERLGEEIYYREIKPNIKTNLYFDFRKKSLDELFEGDGKINDFVRTLGAKSLESNFDITENSITRLLNDRHPNYLAGFSRSDLSKIADELNANSGLKFRYKNADDYKFTSDDARAMLQGRLSPIATKWGGYDFDQSIHALSGNSQDYLRGEMSAVRLFANAGLVEMGQIGGYSRNDSTLQEPSMSNGSDKRVGLLAKYIDDHGDAYTSARLNNWFDVEDHPGYDYNIGVIVSRLQDPVANSGGLYTNLSNLMAENIAAKGGLDSKAIADVLNNPKDAAAIMQDEGMSMLSKITGLGSDTLPNVYKNHDDYAYLDSNEFGLFSGGGGINQLGAVIGLSLGIESLTDASEFLNGYIEKGLQSWSIAMGAKDINNGVSVPAAMVSYTTLAQSVFGDPAKEKEAATGAAKNTGGANANISPEVLVNQAVTEVMNDFKQKANYSVLDAQLIKEDPTIPVGFSQTMITGSDQQRMELLGDYALANVGITDQALSEKIGITLPGGSSSELAKYGQGKISYAEIVGNFETAELSEESLFNWGDSALGFEGGTTSQLYGTYQDYQDLGAAYNAGQISAAEYQANEIAMAVTAVDTLTGGALTEATSPIDDALGLPAGTTLQLGIALATGNYVQAAMIVAGAIFGWGEVKCPDLQQLAKDKVREVLTQTMEFSQEELNSNHDDRVVPSQILTWRKEDIDAMLPYTEKIYGEGGFGGKAGIIQSLNPNEIHVGF